MDQSGNRYLSGDLLYGDDFTEEQVARWFADESEGYASLGRAEKGADGRYGYHAINVRYGYNLLPDIRFPEVLGLGSAFGYEFLPIMHRIDCLTILEPSQALRANSTSSCRINYVTPESSGAMQFLDNSFDLVTSMGTLHHIPNVSFVVSELSRVVRHGGFVLIREPVISMGDWTKSRPGLTPHERGIPLGVFRRIFQAAGLTIISDVPCVFPTTAHLARLGLGFNSRAGVALDQVFSKATAWNVRYHAVAPWQKIRPTSRFFVLTKP